MSTDEKLRAILRAEADRVDPSPAGWDRIRESIAVRSRRRMWLRGSLAAATAMSLVAVAVVVAAPGRDDRGTDGFVATQPPAPEESTAPGLDDDAPVGVWPFTTLAEESEFRSSGRAQREPYLANPHDAALQFAKQYLGIAEPVIRAVRPNEYNACCRRAVFRKIEGTDQEVAVTEVTMNDGTNGRPYYVVGARGGSITVTSPPVAPGNYVASPLTVTGTFAGVDQPIDVILRAAPSAGGGEIARARAEVGPGGWTATLHFSSTAKTGSLLVTTYSNADGGPADAFAAPIGFIEETSPAPTATVSDPPMSGLYPAQFVGVESQRIALYDTRSGKRMRYLTAAVPGGAAMDPVVTDDGQSVVYLQVEGGCAASIRQVAIGGGASRVLVQSTDGRVPSLPAIGPDGTLAYAWSTCTDDGPYDQTSDAQLVVGSKRIPVQAEDYATIRDLAWSPGGDRIAVLANFCCAGRAEIRLVDVTTDMRVIDGELVAADGPCEWTGLAFTLDNRLLASEGCTGRDDGDPRITRIRDLSDPSRRSVLEVDGADWIDAVDVDRTGDHLMLGVLTCEETCDQAPSSAQRFSIDGAPVVVAPDVAQPVWVD